MTTKEKLLDLFESNRGLYFSGEDIAKTLCLSRAAVWKVVKSLQSEGYAISAITNRGYCLSPETDILSSSGIQKYLNFDNSDMEICVLPTVTSTNAYVREKADYGELEGYTVISNEQTAGRGRLGRNFHSPPGTGLYMSTLLRPKNYLAHQAVNITTIAAVAMCEAIEAVSCEKTQIKWVNDIFVRGKKVCGILTEASLSMENGMLEYAVLGIGVNIYRPKNGFPQEIENIAGCIFETPQNDVKNRLAAEFLNNFMMYYATLEKADYAEKYRSRSLVIGKRVTVNSIDQSKSAMVIGIDDNCRLLVKYDDGKEESLSSGEISINL
ncbi:MAG: biotin--[acetyl-CoA-carboxylase] ligase [Eubacteriales bacterium]|nr:biotin--[acetyl-CoA-carboxylase] ligase [Eubacteriales bacterium]